MRSRSILVTGAHGFLGEYFARRISGESGYSMTMTDREHLDVLDKEKLADTLRELKPDAVIHLAALCGAIPSVQEPHRFFETNFTGTLNVLEACRVAGVSRVLFTSSMTVFGKSEEAVDEESPFRPRHPYAASKAAAEILLSNYCQNFGMSAVVSRPALVVGEGCREKHAIADFLETAQAGKIIEIYGPGSHVRDFIHPEDVAESMVSCLNHLMALPAGSLESFNFSTGERYTMLELAGIVCEAAGRRPEETIRHVPTTQQAFSLFTSIDKARMILNWAPKILIGDIARRLANH